MSPSRKLIVLSVILLGLALRPAHSGAQIPVTDGSNLVNNIISAIQNVNQTLRQIQQYKLQIEQYISDVESLIATPVEVWDLLVDTKDRALSIVNVVKNARSFADMIRNRVRNWGNLDYLRGSPCYNAERPLEGCASWIKKFGTEEDKRTTALTEEEERIFEMLAAQGKDVDKEAIILAKLTQKAAKSKNPLQAMQYASAFLAHATGSLEQIRIVMATQANWALTVEHKKILEAEHTKLADRQFLAIPDALLRK